MLNFDWLAGLPLGWAKLWVISTFVIPLIWVLTLKREYIFLGAADQKAWRDLRWWSAVVVAVSVGIYAIF